MKGPYMGGSAAQHSGAILKQMAGMLNRATASIEFVRSLGPALAVALLNGLFVALP